MPSLLSTESYSSIFHQNATIDEDGVPTIDHELSPDLVELIGQFISSDECNAAFNDSVSFLEALREINKILEKRNENIQIRWFPRYKCALAARKVHGCTNTPVWNLTLVGLEHWHMDVQHGFASKTATKLSRSDGFATCPLKPIPDEAYEYFTEFVQREFIELYQKDKKGGLGRHKNLTPAYIELVVNSACESLLNGEYKKVKKDSSRSLETPKLSMLSGGWSNAMSQSGGKWPLLQAVMDHLLSYVPSLNYFCPSLWEKFVCHFEYVLVVSEVENLLPVTRDSSTAAKTVTGSVNKVMTMMKSVARKAAQLTELYDMETFETGLASLHQQLENAMSFRAEGISNDYQLRVKTTEERYRAPRIDLKSLSSIIGEEKSRNDIQKLSRSNIDLFPISRVTGKLVNLLNEHPYKTSNLTAIYLAIRNMESYIFPLASKLKEPQYSFDEKHLEAWANSYQVWSSRLLDVLNKRENGESKSFLKVELISRKVLVMWLIFCLIHNSMKGKEPLVAEYGVPLDWRIVRHFVLSDRLAQTASLHVSLYLYLNKNENPLFCLNDQRCSLEFGERYAMRTATFQKLWEDEKIAASIREEKHWRQVTQKQKTVGELKTQLAGLRLSKEKLEDKLEELSYYDPKWDKVQKKIEKLMQDISSTESDIQAARKPPPSLYQPLPSVKDKAMKMLFFLHMPEDIQRLARSCIGAQYMMVPSNQWVGVTALESMKCLNVRKSIKIDVRGYEDLRAYYNDHCPAETSNCAVFHPYSQSKVPKGSWIGPSDVMEFHSSSQGVYHPDDLHLSLYWSSGGAFLNPFKNINTNVTVEYFTEKTNSSIQYTFTQYGEDTKLDRGNQPIAKQHLKPKWLQKPQWLAFASLRAFPYQQLRRLCGAIRDRRLPLDKPTVHNLIRSTLYHTGNVEKLSSYDEIIPLWKWDMIEGEFCEVMLSELENLCEEIAEKPSQHASMSMLIEIANYLSQWHPKCVQLTRKCVKVIKEWIKGADEQIRGANPKDVPTLRAKKGIFYHQALYCYSEGELSRDEASDMCQILVHAQNDSRFQEDTPYDEQLKVLIHMRLDLMVKRSDILHNIIQNDKYQLLSEAMKVVLYETPPNLEWEVMKYNESHEVSTCYQAEDNKGNIYNINILNGLVLYNGLPLSSLPTSILQHPLYIRSFEDRDFQTCASGKVVKTVMPIKGCLYSFATQRQELVAIEKDVTTNIEFRLLDSIALMNTTTSWGDDLPIILKDLYSHWFCEEKNIILCRDRYFCKRYVEFLLKQTSQDQWKCYRVPSYLKGEIWNSYVDGSVDLDGDFDQLVLHQSCKLDILKKFEETKYIHTFLSSSGDMKIHLPRFNLEFETCSEVRGRWKSCDYAGYFLSENQQLSDTLPHFQRYLILEHCKHRSDDLKVVIPQGNVMVNDKGDTIVQTPDDTSSVLKVFTYQIHNRFKKLQANSICARLHLAELYACTGTLLADKRMRMTGGEVAMQLVRQCWTNKPLTKVEYEKVHALSKKCFGVPALSLLCYELAHSSSQTAFLHPGSESKSVEFPKDFAAEYMQETYPWNLRSSLTADEELRILGHTRQPRYNYVTRCNGSVDLTSNRTISNEIDFITKRAEDCLERYDGLLQDFLKDTEKEQERSTFQSYDDDDHHLTKSSKNLYQFMIKELKKSHEAFNHLQKTELESGSSLFNYFAKEIRDRRIDIECVLFKEFAHIPLSAGPKALSYRILKTARIMPEITFDDLLKGAIKKEWIEKINLFISHESLEYIWKRILIWLELCTLEDKIKRLLRLCEDTGAGPKKANELQIIKELGVYRSWSAEEHPQWLVFEVSAQLQIRPVQHTIAQSMINGIDNNSCNPITQLNMGEGKTRVILPMLVLYWQHTNKVVRLNFLSPLLQEAWEYLHCTLCASILGVKLFLVPFCRDVELTSNNAKTLVASLNYCKQSGGVVLTAPEHRLSFKLKRIELRKKEINKEINKTLDQLDDINFLDILDEVDEILRIKNKLIFALGSQEHLPSKESRWNAIQALLDILWTNESIKSILTEPLVSHRDQQKNRIVELRLLPGEAFDRIKENLVSRLIHELIANPPFELRWLNLLGTNLLSVVEFITTADKNELSYLTFLDHSQRSDIFALRGLLANDVFIHCLMKRNRVDYGVNRVSGRKRMAVPFHACETPSLRAEFGHPDSALLYTCLAYYYDGLSHDEVYEAFSTLQLLGENAQNVIYNNWYELSKPLMGALHETTLDHILKIDLTNSIQVSLLVRYFRHNRFTINFWLNSCVFPPETMQFPYRLEATAWDLATNCRKQVAGFSGTNDDRMIMPTTLQWIEQKDPILIATDGKMLHLLQQSHFRSLEDEITKKENKATARSSSAQWTSVLDFVIREAAQDTEHCTCALIDAGALMAGAPNNGEVANYLAKHLDKGIVYFDIPNNGWWVLDKYGRRWPKHSSPIHEHDGFVYFDESRTRGADMKLRSNSRAILTLGPDMCKDKLMQAAGRMRMLEHGQRLLLVGADDVTSKIRHYNNLDSSIPVTSRHVLEWVMQNSIKNISKWFSEWALQGVHYVTKNDILELAFIPDMTTLEEMYGGSLEERPVMEVFSEKISALKTQMYERSLSCSSEPVLKDINERLRQFSQELVTKVGGNVDEECERELEKEIELEKVVERKIAERDPRIEKKLDIQQFISGGTECFPPLNKLIENEINFEGKCASPQVKEMRCTSTILCTENFFYTCAPVKYVPHSVNDYLRQVDSFLYHTESCKIILLSERECDKFLELAWEMPKFAGYVLLNWTYARRKKKPGKVTFQFPPELFTQGLTGDQLAAVDLFDGEVMFSNERVRQSLIKMLPTQSARQMAPLFSSMRGVGFKYPRSDLELICATPCKNDTLNQRMASLILDMDDQVAPSVA